MPTSILLCSILVLLTTDNLYVVYSHRNKLGGGRGKFPWRSFSMGGRKFPPLKIWPSWRYKEKNWKSMPRGGQKSCPECGKIAQGVKKNSRALRARRFKIILPIPGQISSTPLFGNVTTFWPVLPAGRSVGLSVGGWSVCHNFLKGRQVTLPCS